MRLNEEDFDTAIDAADAWPQFIDEAAFAIIDGDPCCDDGDSFNAHEQNPGNVLL